MYLSYWGYATVYVGMSQLRLSGRRGKHVSWGSGCGGGDDGRVVVLLVWVASYSAATVPHSYHGRLVPCPYMGASKKA